MPKATDQGLSEAAKILAVVEQDGLAGQVIESLARVLPAEMAAVFLYRGRSRPLCLGNSFTAKRARNGLRNYIEATYVLNPFYQAHLKGLSEGVYRIRGLPPDAYFRSAGTDGARVTYTEQEELGFITDHWPKGMEEVEIAIPLEPGVTVEICLLRAMRHGGFTQAHLDELERWRPLVSAALRKHWAFQRARFSTLPADSRADDTLQQFGLGELSAREREVVQLVLKGHSSESIGVNLGISITTVKTHRKRAYGKLNISSQSELFSLFMKQAGLAALGP